MKTLGITALIGGIGFLVYKLLSNLKAGNSNTSPLPNTTATTVITNTPTASPVYNSFTRGEFTATGTIPGGKSFVKITNAGDADGLINVGNGDTTLSPGQSWQFPFALGQIQLLSTAISFDATGTKFLVETQTPV